MKFCLWLLFFLSLVFGTLTQGRAPTVAPKENPKDDFGFLDLSDALDPEEPEKPKTRSGGASDDLGFDLSDALGPDPSPKPTQPPKRGGGGDSFGDSDLYDISQGDYKPEGGHSGGDRTQDPGYDPHGGANDHPQDLDRLWGQILKMLNANMPEEFYTWISNVKRTLSSLLESAVDLLQAIP
ncbi:hypothetical protein LDENG_00196190 [Lucifuga dentata]|nr:hypothetical protein LDENG_00196190 [Lucifuga dentata]